MIGQELGGRYEILDRVGGGGMALVYKGYDILLHRNVAVKVLRQQFVHDEEFIRRFRREAQSAASLSHPNVVSIYDVGQQEDTHYIVMEYIEGRTLNELIKDRAPLQVEEAVHIASQICDALEHAHANQIIHRDIKPHNILIGKNGRVKVTDFGIARAATSSSITQTGSVVGSVHYFSPEHAKGTMAGEKSDLYSLGIVLYQMLTGRLPFLGESPISVALKHLQENVEEPRKVNPLIPQSVENIILKAMRKNPGERYQSAKEMLKDLETCLTPERRNEAKIYFPSQFDADAGEDDQETRVIPAIRSSDNFESEADKQGRNNSKKKKKNPWLAPLIWTLVLVTLIVSLWVTASWLNGKMRIKDVAVPDVVDLTITEAKKKISDANLNFEIVQEYNEKPKDTVIAQRPRGMSIKEGGMVMLTVSKGIELQMMPSYEGKKFKDVKLELIASGLKEAQIVKEEKFIDEPIDTIVQQSPKAGEEFDPTKVQIKFIVSKGRETASMPDLVGLTANEAKSKLALIDITLLPENIILTPSFQPKGKIFKQFPFNKGDDVQPGDTSIKVYVSSGPPEDAGELPVSVVLEPAKEGKTSVFRIVVSDAQYDNYEIKTVQTNKELVQNVRVTVTKDKDAVIQVFRDNELFVTQKVTYEQFQSGTVNQKPTATPKDKPTPTPSEAGANGAKPVVLPTPTPAGGN